jgi:hypothetical protein
MGGTAIVATAAAVGSFPEPSAVVVDQAIVVRKAGRTNQRIAIAAVGRKIPMAGKSN